MEREIISVDPGVFCVLHSTREKTHNYSLRRTVSSFIDDEVVLLCVYIWYSHYLGSHDPSSR